MVSGPIPFLGLKPNRHAPADETGIFAVQLRRFVGCTVISIVAPELVRFGWHCSLCCATWFLCTWAFWGPEFWVVAICGNQLVIAGFHFSLLAVLDAVLFCGDWILQAGFLKNNPPMGWVANQLALLSS